MLPKLNTINAEMIPLIWRQQLVWQYLYSWATDIICCSSTWKNNSSVIHVLLQKNNPSSRIFIFIYLILLSHVGTFFSKSCYEHLHSIIDNVVLCQHKKGGLDNFFALHWSVRHPGISQVESMCFRHSEMFC